MKVKIGIIGLGYVGLPLAVSFAKKFEVYLARNVYTFRIQNFSLFPLY